MKHLEFDTLVRQIELRYRNRPAQLARRTGRWAFFGLAGFVAIPLGLLVLAALLFVCGVLFPYQAGLLCFPLAGLLGCLGLVPLVRLGRAGEMPEGRLLGRDEGEPLWSLLEHVEHRAGRRHFTHILLTIDLNASVMDRYRYGLYGGAETILSLGWPLLQILSPDQLEAVIAHELAHHEARHLAISSWVHRLWSCWNQLLMDLANRQRHSFRHWLHWLLSTFIEWYWPRFSARYLVVSRMHEYEADSRSVALTGQSIAVEVLWRIACFNRLMTDRFLPEIWKGPATASLPPTDVYRQFGAFLTQPVDLVDAARWQLDIVSSVADSGSTHPEFSDRVRAMGLDPQALLTQPFPAPPDMPATTLLDSGLESELELMWRTAATPAWIGQRNRTKVLQSPHDAAPSAENEAPAQLWERARKILETAGAAEAAPLLRLVLAGDPSDVRAGYILGRHLADEGQDEGATLLWRVVESRHEDYAAPACQALKAWYLTRGQADRVTAVVEEQDKIEASLALAQKERSNVTPHDRFIPHRLTADERHALVNLLKSERSLERAWIVEKDLAHLGPYRLFVIVVQSGRNWLGYSRAEWDLDIVRRVVKSIRLPGRVLVIAPQGGFRKLARTVMSLPEALLIS